MAYEDAKHRPHAIHTGEEPTNPITYGPDSLKVTLDRWGPTVNLFTSMYDALQANWGESPSRTVNREPNLNLTIDTRVNDPKVAFVTGWTRLLPDERDYVESCFAGKTLQQVLEGITFDFCIDGVSRAFTHQNVRTRLGAGFMQHGGRDNDWRHRAWTMPETIRRACAVHDKGALLPESLEHCITNWEPIKEYLSHQPVFDGMESKDGDPTLHAQILKHIDNGRRLYSALVDAGIPWQDARRVLFMGMQTYIHDQYNWIALSGVLANRLEHIMDWEFNCVAQLMLREVKMKCPPIISKYLGSHSDKAKAARFAGLESWPPDGKYPNPYERCAECGHAQGNHLIDREEGPAQEYCEVCKRDPEPGGHRYAPYHKYVGKDSLTRQHRPEQMPFFVLAPESMEGGQIRWIPTNGKYPHDQIK